MKLKSKFSLCVAILALAGTSLARTWTSSVGKNTFEGEFVSATEENVTVKRAGGSTVTFPISKLSEDDQEFVKLSRNVAAAEETARKESAELRKAAVPKAIDGRMVKLDGSRLSKIEKFEDSDIVPKYYFLAYTASW